MRFHFGHDGLSIGGTFCGVNGAGSSGDYWSSSLGTDNSHYAYCLTFDSSNVYVSGYDVRYYGLSVRPVCLSQK